MADLLMVPGARPANPLTPAQLAAARDALVERIDAAVPSNAVGAAISPTFAQVLAIARTALKACDAPVLALSNARDAWEAASAALPHVTTRSAYETHTGDFRHMSTSDPAQVGLARRMLRDPIALASCEDVAATCRELVEAADVRDAERDRLRAVYGIDRLLEQSSAAEDQSYTADTAVMDYPVATAADLLAKLAFMEEVGTIGDGPNPSIIVADVRRVLAGGLN